MLERHLHPGYCSTKPLLGLAFGLLVDRFGIALDTRVPVPSADGDGVPVPALLNHSAGLAAPRAIDWRVRRADERATLRSRISSGPRPEYSEMAAGLLLEELIERVAGRPAAAFIEEQILSPLGVADDLVIDPERAVQPAVRRRLSVPIAGLPDRYIPMLSERILLHDTGPTLGGLVSASGLCRLYAALERCVSGVDLAGLPSPATTRTLLDRRRGSVQDGVLDKRCDFAGGFMVRLAEHGFGYCLSDRAFGHVGGNGPSLGFCDPASGLAAGIYLNGATVGLDDHSSGVRAMIIDEIIDECS
jgi:CubicO group peptidase (beta-lactamase class C family)